MNVRGTGQRTPDRSTAPIYSRQDVQTRKRRPARLPWWRQPPVGYVVTFPLVGLGLLIPFGLQHLGIDNAFLDTPFVLVTLIIALMSVTSTKGVDRKSTRLNSSHVRISHAVFCLKKKNHDLNAARALVQSDIASDADLY